MFQCSLLPHMKILLKFQANSPLLPSHNTECTKSSSHSFDDNICETALLSYKMLDVITKCISWDPWSVCQQVFHVYKTFKDQVNPQNN